MEVTRHEKTLGCILGGAVGDAMGYPVEFLSYNSIIKKYGSNGVQFPIITNGYTEISDDTQMTMFTANGLLYAQTRGMNRGILGPVETYVFNAYQEWLLTQHFSVPQRQKYQMTWLLNLPQMYSMRAPGNTCITALEYGTLGTIENPINDSKGCGGVMRVSPVALFMNPAKSKQENIDLIGAKIAALTHGHPLGYIPAAILTHIISKITYENFSIIEAVESSLISIRKLFSGNELQYQINLIKTAITLANSSTEDSVAIKQIGEGWMAEETISIAIYCSIKYSNDFSKAIIASINHDGDSDSTGSITGNILGASLGYNAIPDYFLEHLELREFLMILADDLFSQCQWEEYSLPSKESEKWFEKYIYATFPENIDSFN